MITVILVDQNSTVLKHMTACLEMMQKRGDIFLFSDLDEFLSNQPTEIDLILLDIDLYDLLALPSQLRKKVIALSKTAEKATYAYELNVLGYVPKPLTQSIIQGILMETVAKYEVKQTMVNTKNGYVKIDVGEINYIDITRRNLCYHLIDNSEIISVTIRKSFSTYIGAFQYNPSFLFIEPAFLINLDQIAKLDLDRVTFKNNAIVYINKKQYEKIYAAWAE